MSWAFEKNTDKVLFCGGGCGVVRQSYCKELAWWEGGECFLGGRAGVVCLCGGGEGGWMGRRWG